MKQDFENIPGYVEYDYEKIVIAINYSLKASIYNLLLLFIKLNSSLILLIQKQIY